MSYGTKRCEAEKMWHVQTTAQSSVDCQTGLIICKHRGECHRPVHASLVQVVLGTRMSRAGLLCHHASTSNYASRIEDCTPGGGFLARKPRRPNCCYRSYEPAVSSRHLSTVFISRQDTVLQLKWLPISAAVAVSVSCKVEAASESGRSDPKLSGMESGLSGIKKYILVP